MWTAGTCINGSLSCSHGHIGCVSNQCCSLHNALNLAVHFHSKLLHKMNITGSQCEVCYHFFSRQISRQFLPPLYLFILFQAQWWMKVSENGVFIFWQNSTNLRKVAQHFRHFISALATANVDNDIAVGVLGEWLWDYSLSTSKGSWDGSGAALHTTVQQK